MGRYLELAKAVEAADFCGEEAFSPQSGDIGPKSEPEQVSTLDSSEFDSDRECEKSEISEKRSEPASVADRAPTTTTHPTVFLGSDADAQDWRDWYEERAAIAEHDRDLPRAEAKALAYERCVVQWMNLNPPPENGPECCVQCGNPMDDLAALPFLTGAGGHVWMHSGCHTPWMRRRQAEAASALRRMGVAPPSI
jgi:hypothetical protein